MAAQGRVGDNAKVPADSHGNPCCAHTCVGPGTNGSPNVTVNDQKALRVTDPGKHSACCGANTWKASQGSSTVTINNLPAHRVGDQTTHCGGMGQLIVGSPNVDVGGAPTGSASGPGTASAGHPVDVASGRMFTHPSEDFVLPGIFPVAWSRSYRSSSALRDCGLGFGWSHDLYWSADRVGDRVFLLGPDGQPVEALLPVEGRVVALPFGRALFRRGDTLFLDLRDGLLRVLRRSPEGMHRLTELTDASGNIARVGWNGHEIARVIDSVGRRAFLVKEGHRRAWLAHARGAASPRTLAVYELDARGDLVRATDARRRTTEYTYDHAHRMMSERRADGLVFQFRYATFGDEARCVETWGEIPGRDVLRELGAPPSPRPVGPPPSSLAFGPGPAPSRVHLPADVPPKGIFHTSLRYGPAESTVIDGVGSTHRYELSPLGVVTKYTDPSAVARTYAYDAGGRQTSFTDGLGNETTLSYDDEGRPTSKSDANGTTEVLAGRGGIRAVKNPDGSVWQSRCDARGRVVEVTDPSGGRRRYGLDARGQRTSVTLPDGGVVSSAYDAQGNLIRRANADGATWTFEYDPFGILTTLTDPTGKKTTLFYDDGNNLVAKDTAGLRTEYELDALKRIVATKYASGAVIRCRYVADALVETTLPDGAVWRMGFDAVLRPAWLVNAAGERYEIRCDARGNPAAASTFAGVRQSCEYDAEGRLSHVVRSDGSSVAISYDAAGRVLTCAHSSGASERYAYDPGGRLLLAELTTRGRTVAVEYTRDALGAVVREVQTVGDWRFSVDYVRDAASRAVSRRYSSGWSVDVQRSPSGLPVRVRVGGESAHEVLELEHDARANELARRRAGQAVLTQRNAEGLPERVTVVHAGRPVRERTYAWSAHGAVTAIGDAQYGTRSYSLDARGRILGVDGLGADERFVYSAHGTPVSSRGPATAQLGRGGRPLNTRTSTLAWDDFGRLASRRDPDPLMCWAYEYDERHQLAAAVRGDGLRVDYVSDALGRRLLELCEGNVTRYGWDGDGLVEEQGTGTLPTRRVFKDDAYSLLLESTDGGGFRLVATDAAGTPWTYLDATGGIADIDLTATGAVARASENPGRLRFAGQRADSLTGLSYNRHRTYSPELGVFLSPDPLELRGSGQDIAFVPNPTCSVDPLGLFVAVIEGDLGDSAVQTWGNYDVAANPGAQLFTPSQLTPGSLAGADSVIIDAHGAPGQTWFDGKPVNGVQLGQDLNAAGFKGGPNRPVTLHSCNGGTQPIVAAGPNGNYVMGDSSARQLSDTTGSPVGAATSNSPLASNSRWFGANEPNTLVLGDPHSGELSDHVQNGTWQTFQPSNSTYSPI